MGEHEYERGFGTEFDIFVFLSETKNQCEFALEEFAEFDTAAQPLDNDAVFRAVHGMLTHASCVSRMLWPASNGDVAQERGRILRRELGLPEDHPLAVRKIRNHLEHFNERLDDWVLTTRTRSFADRHIGPIDDLIDHDLDEGDIMRAYDPERRVLVFRGEEYDLLSIRAALQDVLSRTEQKANELDDYLFHHDKG